VRTCALGRAIQYSAKAEVKSARVEYWMPRFRVA
jgi:hypothetical protein